MTTNPLFAFGLGIGTRNAKGQWLEVYYPEPMLHLDAAQMAEASQIADLLSHDISTKAAAAITVPHATLAKIAALLPRYADLAGSTKPVVAVFLSADQVLSNVPEAYLKLHLLSHRLCRPHSLNLTGLFATLLNVAWTNHGAIDVNELATAQRQARLRGDTLTVAMVDKFPRMTDYVVPTGVRIADTARVRLGAYIGSGTTIMQEGFVNFNAGTEGPNMVEGRVSSSVWVGSGSDLGGGCSTMGILSGGNSRPIAVGKNCLLGANAGLGIPIGDDCTLEAGLYLTAASKVRILSRDGTLVRTMKAIDLAGRSGLLFRRNSLDGAIECLPNKKSIELNADLHTHN